MQAVLATAASLPLAGVGGTLVGLLELLGWMVLVLGLAAGTTYGMVRATAGRRKRDADADSTS